MSRTPKRKSSDLSPPLVSLNHLAGTFKHAPSALAKTLQALGHAPKLIVADVPYYDGEVLDDLADELGGGGSRPRKPR